MRLVDHFADLRDVHEESVSPGVMMVIEVAHVNTYYRGARREPVKLFLGGLGDLDGSSTE